MQEGIRTGRIGNLLNLWGADETRAVQRLAIEESRLGVPLLMGLDVIHGHHTIFPVSLAEACQFSPDLWERTARVAAEEAAEDGVALTFAPMLDVARDPRWGRIIESPGEDTWVASQMAAAKTRGFQGPNLAAQDSVAATAKHLCAYGAVTAGREYASAEVSERTLHEIYLPPFAAAVAAGTAAIMPAFIDVSGAPMTANAKLLQGWLRGIVGFEGVLISDYNAVAELLNHGVAADLVEAAALALNAGRRHRHDERRLHPVLAGGAATRPRNNGHDRRQRAAGAQAEGAPRAVRRSLSPRIGPAGCAPSSGAARAGAGRSAEGDCAPVQPHRDFASFPSDQTPRRDRPSG